MPQTNRDRTAAFDDVVETHSRAIYGYLRARLINSADAVRLTEAVFETFYADPVAGSDDNIRSHLFALARAALIDEARVLREKNGTDWTVLCLDCEDADAGSRNNVDIARLRASLEFLDPPERDATTMKYRSGWTLSQIGERLRRSESAVKLLLFRARTSLHASWRS